MTTNEPQAVGPAPTANKRKRVSKPGIKLGSVRKGGSVPSPMVSKAMSARLCNEATEVDSIACITTRCFAAGQNKYHYEISQGGKW